MYYQIKKASGEPVCRAKLAESFLARAIGLMFKRDLPEGEGLIIRLPSYARRAAIHSFFMRFPIDLYFIDAELRVAEHARLKPWGWYKPEKPCEYVLEVKEGSVDLKPGERLEFIPLLARRTEQKY